MRNTTKATLMATIFALGALGAPATAGAFQRTDAIPQASTAVQLADGRDWREGRREARKDWREERRERIKERREDRREARKEWREERRERLQDRREALRDWRADRRDDWRDDWRDRRSDWRDDRWRGDWRDDRRAWWGTDTQNQHRWQRHPRYGQWVGHRLPRIAGLVTLSDWRRYRLPSPPPGHFYARATDDIFLVHRATHRVVEMLLLR